MIFLAVASKRFKTIRYQCDYSVERRRRFKCNFDVYGENKLYTCARGTDSEYK